MTLGRSESSAPTLRRAAATGLDRQIPSRRIPLDHGGALHHLMNEVHETPPISLANHLRESERQAVLDQQPPITAIRFDFFLEGRMLETAHVVRQWWLLLQVIEYPLPPRERPRREHAFRTTRGRRKVGTRCAAI